MKGSGKLQGCAEFQCRLSHGFQRWMFFHYNACFSWVFFHATCTNEFTNLQNRKTREMLLLLIMWGCMVEVALWQILKGFTWLACIMRRWMVIVEKEIYVKSDQVLKYTNNVHEGQHRRGYRQWVTWGENKGEFEPY